jgi:hypothetical protein
VPEIEIPKPELTDYGRAQFATEVAFGALVKQAKEMGLDVAPVMGLMYLPTQEMTYAFQVACRTILLALTPHSSHVEGSDGNDYWQGDGNIPG